MAAAFFGLLAGLVLVGVLTGVLAVAELFRYSEPLWVLGVPFVLAALAFLAFRVGGRAAEGGGWSTAGAGLMVLLSPGLLWFAVYTTDIAIRPTARRSRLAADQGTMGALRAAAAIYYGKNGAWPTQATLQTLVQPSPPVFQCTGATWSLDTTNGKITYSPNDLSALGGC